MNDYDDNMLDRSDFFQIIKKDRLEKKGSYRSVL